MREELQLRQWVRGVDAQVGVGPGCAGAVVAQHLDATPDAEAIRDPRVALRIDVEVAVQREPLPQIFAQRGARDLFGPLARLLVITRGKISASGPFGEVIPVVTPGSLDGAIAAGALGSGRGQQIPREQTSP